MSCLSSSPRPEFDPFCEETKWVDLWVRVPRSPIKLLNYESVANLFAASNIGSLVKLHQNSLLRNKIRFARACVHADIIDPLSNYAAIC